MRRARVRAVAEAGRPVRGTMRARPPPAGGGLVDEQAPGLTARRSGRCTTRRRRGRRWRRSWESPEFGLDQGPPFGSIPLPSGAGGPMGSMHDPVPAWRVDFTGMMASRAEGGAPFWIDGDPGADDRRDTRAVDSPGLKVHVRPPGGGRGRQGAPFGSIRTPVPARTVVFARMEPPSGCAVAVDARAGTGARVGGEVHRWSSPRREPLG
jgi:hypothetical protein